MSPRTPNFGATHRDYLAHRPAFVPPLYDRLRAFGIGLPGQRILDLGAGTGLFSNPLAEMGAHVTAVDVSRELISHSQSLRVLARAELLPFADSSFDIVTAAQCWHWFDRTRAPAEIFRVLKPHGALAVVYQTYIPLPGSIAEATEKIILHHQPHWRHANSTGINGQVLRDVQISGFTHIETFSFDIEIDFTRTSWAGFVRTTSPVVSMNPANFSSFEREHTAMLQPVSSTFAIPHRVFALVTRRPVSL